LECGGSTPLWIGDFRNIQSGVEPPHSKWADQAFSFISFPEVCVSSRLQSGVRAARGRNSLAGMAFLLLLPGCGNKTEPPPVVSVKGKIVCQGKAVPGVLIRFWPRQAEPATRPVETVSGEKGEFSLSCPPGSYKVTVMNVPVSGTDPGLAAGGRAPPAGSPMVTVPGNYSDRVETPLTVEAPEGGTDQLVLTVYK